MDTQMRPFQPVRGVSTELTRSPNRKKLRMVDRRFG